MISVSMYSSTAAAAVFEYGAGGVHAGLGVHERQEKDSVGFGLFDEPERELGDNAEGSLAADNVLCAAELNYASVGEDGGAVNDIVCSAAVFDGAGTGGVGGGVAAYGSGLFAGVGG